MILIYNHPTTDLNKMYLSTTRQLSIIFKSLLYTLITLKKKKSKLYFLCKIYLLYHDAQIVNIQNKYHSPQKKYNIMFTIN